MRKAHGLKAAACFRRPGGTLLKTALEIALEKTRDITPQDDPNALSDEAKKQIRAINKEYDARIAEIEIKTSSKLREMQGQYSEQELQSILPGMIEQIKSQKDAINAERKEKTDAVAAQDLKNRADS